MCSAAQTERNAGNHNYLMETRMNLISRRSFAAYAGLATLGLAHAQAPFPSKPISLVVPYAPGGPTDAMARILATAIKPVLGQTMIVENKAGADPTSGRRARRGGRPPCCSALPRRWESIFTCT
jgi:hypothetical protein